MTVLIPLSHLLYRNLGLFTTPRLTRKSPQICLAIHKINNSHIIRVSQNEPGTQFWNRGVFPTVPTSPFYVLSPLTQTLCSKSLVIPIPDNSPLRCLSSHELRCRKTFIYGFIGWFIYFTSIYYITTVCPVLSEMLEIQLWEVWSLCLSINLGTSSMTNPP